MVKQKIGAVFSLLLALTLLIPTGRYFEAKAEEKIMFDEENIVLSFGVLSDVHICEAEFYGEWEQIYYSADKFTAAANFYKEKIGEDNMPIMVLGGDVLDTLATVDGVKAQKVFSACIDSSKTELFLTPGNHDMYYSSSSYVTEHDPTSLYAASTGFSDYNPYAAFFGRLVYQDKSRTSETLIKQGYYHTVVEGYHFLSMVSIAGDPSDLALTWLKNEMRTIREEGNDGKPVFVVSHVPVTEKTERVLKDYPELVFLTGHTHESVFGDPCVISRPDSFTSVHCGALKTRESSDIPELGMIEIDANNTIRYSTYYMTYTEEGEETPKKRSYTVVEPDGNDHIFRVNERKEVPSAPVISSTPVQEASSAPDVSDPGTSPSAWMGVAVAFGLILLTVVFGLIFRKK